MFRSQMVAGEREYRSRLKPYISYRELVRGTLSVRERVCGKSNCRCAKGRRHISLFLSRGRKGKVEQLYIPKEKEELVRRWVKNYRDVQGLLEKISSIYWDRLRRKG
jgi:hypothetical protein